MELIDNASDRIKRFRQRYLDEVPFISIERALYYTEKWKETKKSGFSLGVRVALSMKHTYENMEFNIDPDDRIAGTWTENFLGIPIDIERGLFNNVFEIEFDKKKMRKFASEGNKKLFEFLNKKNINAVELVEVDFLVVWLIPKHIIMIITKSTNSSMQLFTYFINRFSLFT